MSLSLHLSLCKSLSRSLSYQMISFQKIYGLYGLEHHIVETNGEGEGCHKCAGTDIQTDTHSEYSVNLDSNSQYTPYTIGQCGVSNVV